MPDLRRPDADASDSAPVHDVLYVEDQPVNVLLMQALLAMRPAVRLTVAGTAAEGLRAALAQRPALMLLDLHLPDGNGVSLLQSMRSHASLREVPAVAVTADTQAELLTQGFADVWTKPLDLAATLRRLDRLLLGAADGEGLGFAPSVRAAANAGSLPRPGA